MAVFLVWKGYISGAKNMLVIFGMEFVVCGRCGRR